MTVTPPDEPVWGVALGKQHGPRRVAELAAGAESLGFHEVWVSNERFYRDMFVSLAAAAVATETPRLGTFVMDPYTMHPALMASAVATLDDLSSGRAMAGIGAGGTGLPNMRINRERPVAAVRDAVHIMRGLLSGEEVTHQGDMFEAHNTRLSLPLVGRPPVIVASQSPQMLKMSGRHADATMISTFASPRSFRRAFEHVLDGIRQRPEEESHDVIARIDVAISEDRQQARRAVRPIMMVMLFVTYPRWDFLTDLGLEVPEEVWDLVAGRDYGDCIANAQLIPDSIVDEFTWAGTAEEVAAKVSALREAGVDRFTILPHNADGDVVETIERFARDVIPLVDGDSG